MGESSHSPLKTGFPFRNITFLLLTLQYTSFVLLLHYSRIGPTVRGKRYVTSTAVFLNEVIKLAISLTIALYEISRRAPPSMPATSLFFSLSNAVLSGDSWKLALPAILYTVANSLQYIALSNLDAATFQVTYQLKILLTAFFGLLLLRRNIPVRNWALLLFLAAGVVLVQLPRQAEEPVVMKDDRLHAHIPRSLDEWKEMGGIVAANIQKRSATYEGIQEDMLLEHPPLNDTVGLLATLGACVASAFATISFEKVIRDSTIATSLWVRNVQLAIYSIFPAFFIGVVFNDGETIASQGFFAGYSWLVWLTIVIQAVGGIGAAFSIAYTDGTTKNCATGVSIALSVLGSLALFDTQVSANFLIGTIVVLVATFLYGNQPSSANPVKLRPPPIRIESYENGDGNRDSGMLSPPNDFSIKLPSTPLLSAMKDSGLSSSRPTSPNHVRVASNRNAAAGSYFPKNPEE